MNEKKDVMAEVARLIEQFEIPEEYHHAIWEAYSEGVKRGYIKGALSVNQPTNRKND